MAKRVNSRRKGKVGELDWRDHLRGMGYADAERGQQRSGSADSPDVKGGFPGTHPEVKRTERINIHAAYAQAVRDAAGNAIPYVAYRQNRKPWMVVVCADHLEAFARAVLAGRTPNAQPGGSE